MPRVAALLLALLSLTAFAASASAQTTNAPPGQSAIDQYLETVPGDGGSNAAGDRPDPAGADVARKAADALPAATLRALERSGADGKAAAALAGTLAPTSTSGRTAPATSPAGDVLGERASSGLLSTVVYAVTGTEGGGFGTLFPLLLAVILVVVVAVALARRRSGGAPA